MEPTQEMKDMMVEDQQMIRSVTRMEDQPQGVPSVQSTGPMRLIEMAVQRGASMDELDRLMLMAERYDNDLARKAYASDMARFKAAPIQITKDKQVGYMTDKGDFVGYWHASIGNVVAAIVPALATFGFSHRWDVEQRDGLVIVTCVITHRLGHSQSTTLMANPDSSGKKNAIQSIISAKTYLERHTLLAATGLATKDSEDDDGAGAGIGREEREELRQEGRSMRQRANPADVAARGQQSKPCDPALLSEAQAAADQGEAAFGVFWKSINGVKRTALGLHLEDLAARCKTADKAPGSAA